MISHSKSRFRDRHPDQAAVFNANVCIEGGKIWFGDFNLTVDEPLLLELASQLVRNSDRVDKYQPRASSIAHADTSPSHSGCVAVQW